MGESRKLQRCDNCLSAAHRMVNCYALGEEDVDVNGRVKAVEMALLALTHGGPSRVVRTSDICWLFNEKHCNFCSCKYKHVCHWYGGAHLGFECQQMSKPEGLGPIRLDNSRSGGGATLY